MRPVTNIAALKARVIQLLERLERRRALISTH